MILVLFGMNDTALEFFLARPFFRNIRRAMMTCATNNGVEGVLLWSAIAENKELC
jgi:hypothetical protein